MTLVELTQHLHDGREIEFSFCSHRYFISPDFVSGKFEGNYTIYDNDEHKTVFSGPMEDLLCFKFAPFLVFSECIPLFNIEYVL